MENLRALMPVTPMRSPNPRKVYPTHEDIGLEDTKILHSLNLKLQFKVHNLENEIGRLKEEVQGYKGKHFIYDSLTRDLASLRNQLDKTALALLKKCDAYDKLKEELASIKKQYNISPKSSQDPQNKLNSSNPQSSGNVKRKLAIYQEIMDMSDTESIVSRRSSRSSMGSCGNISKQISDEEAIPSCLKAYAAPSGPLRNQVLMKLHTIRSASTESLESVGRKSLKLQEASAKTAKPSVVSAQPKKNKTNLNASVQSLKSGVVKVPPSVRPALGQNNGRVVKVNTALKKSNSSCSAKSRPAFRV